MIILCSARSCERSKTRFNEWTSGKEGRKEYRNRRFFRNYLILPPSSSPSCVYMYNHDIRAILYPRNILNSWPCLRPVFVSMHPIVPHYCIVALECLIQGRGVRTKPCYYKANRWSTYNSKLFIVASLDHELHLWFMAVQNEHQF